MVCNVSERKDRLGYLTVWLRVFGGFHFHECNLRPPLIMHTIVFFPFFLFAPIMVGDLLVERRG